VFSLYLADKNAGAAKTAERITEPRDLPFVREALDSLDEGGYPEALARVACLLARKGEPLLLSRLQTRKALIDDYRDLLPAMPWNEWRRIRGEQEIIVRYEPDRALATLPKLLAARGDRERLVGLVRRLLADERVRSAQPSTEQLAMLANIGDTLDVRAPAAKPARRGAKKPATRKPAAKKSAAKKPAAKKRK